MVMLCICPRDLFPNVAADNLLLSVFSAGERRFFRLLPKRHRSVLRII
ncbi:hypothetical protein C4J92_0322 [Pseudomonas sp. R3-18-08]|nr:hypothetical protein C4J92_0322 [Pseudomonas sp. R3-18-08]AZF45577.1 hypothetical protein C4J86_0309 [Pseudomonas sp. R2-7-07]